MELVYVNVTDLPCYREFRILIIPRISDVVGAGAGGSEFFKHVFQDLNRLFGMGASIRDLFKLSLEGEDPRKEKINISLMYVLQCFDVVL